MTAERRRNVVIFSLSCMSTVNMYDTSGVLPAGMSNLHSCLGQPLPLLPALSPA